MSTEKRRILDLLAQGRISADEAERLLDAISEPATPDQPEQPGRPNGKCRFFCVKVDPKEGHSHGRRKGQINIKIPLALMKAGIKLGSVLPGVAKDRIEGHLSDHGLDLKKMDIDELVRVLQETGIDIDDERESVRIYCC
jgi:hypothetical protein